MPISDEWWVTNRFGHHLLAGTLIDAMVGATRLDEDLSVAVDAAQRLDRSLSLVVVHCAARQRGRRRLVRLLETADGAVYELGPGSFAVVLPGATPWAAFMWALAQHRELAHSLLRPRVGISCGVAGVRRGDDGAEILRRASVAAERATADAVPAWLERVAPNGPESLHPDGPARRLTDRHN